MKNKGYKAIKQGMRRNEVELLAHLRTHSVFDTWRFNRAWHNALDRLAAAKQVRYNTVTGCYQVVRGGRPVTPAVR